WFPVIGFNYRMMNLPAAIGLAQVERADWHIRRRHEVANTYKRLLQDSRGLLWQEERDWVRHAHWMFTVILDKDITSSRDEVMSELLEFGIETRPVFYPLHLLPPYREAAGEQFPVAEWLAQDGLSLPTWAGVDSYDVRFIFDCPAGGRKGLQ